MPDSSTPNFDLSMDLENMLDGDDPLKPPSGDKISEEEQKIFHGYAPVTVGEFPSGL